MPPDTPVPSDGAPVLVPVLESHRFDEAALARYLVGRLPGFTGERLTVRQFQGGQSNPTFHLGTPGGDYVLRKKPPGRLLPSAHQVEREFRAMRALAGSGVPVPAVHLLCEDEAVIGTPFFVMDHVPGRIYADRVMGAGTPAERAAVYAELARVLAALHRVDWRAAGLADFGRAERYMERQVKRWARQWEASKVEEVPAMDRTAAWLLAHLPADEETAIAHGDYRLGNVILHPREPRILAVLDWELATLGHPLADLAYACLTYHMHPGPSGLTGVLGTGYEALGIPTQEAFVAEYCRHAGRPVPAELDVFVVFSMFRLASIVAGVWRRALDGNASDPRAIGYRERYRSMAERAWSIAQRLGA
ncbi:Predicted kinase, aminoglycoside phosphotransferase (APT) family [Roseomonas rosea]|uniref:Predicted kinase, aminoglycoside phosphotransferase (APT) family n=1 Tax=Muricoccus roseus TaxID=198092 RepID=A0A1M6KJ88_9PROT|nr:phosphotransferase [Roseomonas rosea]SHJ59026.1 Predicted kinase, aminoglycoside phosphotransferase (APT) family [Roseomonas rosea]